MWRKVRRKASRGTIEMSQESTPVSYRAAFFGGVAVLALLAAPFFRTAQAQDANQDPLPDGPGKQLVETKCTQCHDEFRFATLRMSSDGWADVLNTMGQNGLQLSDDEYASVMKYLSTYLGTAPPPVNVNKATADALKTALGLSDAEAGAIVKFRTDHGDFKTWQEVAGVDGVDPKKIEAKKDSIVFQ
jgi:competence protein ComEA